MLHYMTRNWFWFGLIMAMVLIYSSLAVAQLPTNPDEASIAVGYSSIAGDTGLDVLLAVPYELDALKGYVTGITQRSDTLNRTKYHAEIGTGFSGWDMNIYTNGLIKQYTGAEAGRVSGLGIAVELPEQAVGAFQVTASVGVEGLNGGQIGAPNAGDILEGQNFDPEKLDELGLYSLTPNRTGLTLQQGNAFKGAINVELSHASGISLNIKALPDVASESDYKAHQVIVSGSTSIEISDKFSLDIGADVGVQTSPVEMDTIEYEHALFVGGKYTF